MKKIWIKTLGCKVNQYESTAFRNGLEAQGFLFVKKEELADIIIINSCAVTANATAQSRQIVHRALQKNPAAKIVITGCYVEEKGAELLEDPLLQQREHSLIGNSEKDSLVATVMEELPPGNRMGEIHLAKTISRLPVTGFANRTRAYLRIQDGCNSFCSYCIVPHTRGPSRSLPPAEAIDQAKILAAQGHKEIVITGIHLGYYGADLTPSTRLTDLVKSLVNATSGIYYRLSSLEPTEIEEALLTTVAEKQQIHPHFHIPLQNGSDAILGKMNRKYSTADFADLVARIKETIPHCGIGIDILAGFPGETEKDFQKTLAFLEDLDITYLHAFPYSPRPGTPAADYPGQLNKKIKEERVARLLELGRNKQRSFFKSQEQKIRRVLVEGRRDRDGRLKAISDNYIPVRFKGPDSLMRDSALVKLTRTEDQYMLGILVADDEG